MACAAPKVGAMPGFRPPEWAAQPCRMATVEVRSESSSSIERHEIDGKAHYTFGRDATSCDIELRHSSCSRMHAAVVHHEDGRLFLIDLQSAHGTRIDGHAVQANKPMQLRNGATVTFGDLPNKYIFECEGGGEKRRPGDSGDKHGGGKRQHTQTVRASHLLVKHRGSRRPASWKEPGGCTRSQEDALEMVQRFRDQICNGASGAAQVAERFAALAAAESHCSSYRRGGDLGEFGPGKMQPAFEQAAFALQVGEVSPPTVSDSGVHIILRTG
eukprot:jgi/Tetstr1/460872/TSEL_006030.t1